MRKKQYKPSNHRGLQDANKNDRKPNMIQSAFADFFNDINAVRDDIHKDIQRQSKRVAELSSKERFALFGDYLYI